MSEPLDGRPTTWRLLPRLPVAPPNSLPLGRGALGRFGDDQDRSAGLGGQPGRDRAEEGGAGRAEAARGYRQRGAALAGGDRLEVVSGRARLDDPNRAAAGGRKTELDGHGLPLARVGLSRERGLGRAFSEVGESRAQALEDVHHDGIWNRRFTNLRNSMSWSNVWAHASPRTITQPRT